MINPVNPKRKKELFKAAYGSKERLEWVIQHRCAITGRAGNSADPIVPAHVKTKATGGGADMVIPLLASLENEIHNLGVDSFEKKHNVSLRLLAAVWDKKWKRHEEEY